MCRDCSSTAPARLIDALKKIRQRELFPGVSPYCACRKNHADGGVFGYAISVKNILITTDKFKSLLVENIHSFSGKELSYFDEETKEHIVPYVIEPAVGVDRSVLAFLCAAYAEEPDKDETRVLLHLHPALAPIKVAILPLSRREPLVKAAKEIYADLRQHWMISYDDAQSVGRRYRRQDEIGTPFCVTVDFQSLEDNQVTIRERDTMNQIRLPIAELKNTLQAKLAGEDLFVLPPGGKIWKEEKKGV